MQASGFTLTLNRTLKIKFLVSVLTLNMQLKVSGFTLTLYKTIKLKFLVSVLMLNMSLRFRHLVSH